MKRIIAFILALVMVVSVSMTAFAATSINKAPANAPKTVKNVEKAWNKSPIDGFALIYDDTNKRVLLTNDTVDGQLLVDAGLGYYGSKTERTAIKMFGAAQDAIDTMYVGLKGSGWDCGFCVYNNSTNKILLNYSPLIGWF